MWMADFYTHESSLYFFFTQAKIGFRTFWLRIIFNINQIFDFLSPVFDISSVLYRQELLILKGLHCVIFQDKKEILNVELSIKLILRC